MSSSAGSRPLVVLDARECWRLLSRDTLARIAYTHEGHPIILPVNYVVSGRDVMLRTDPGSALGQVIDGKAIALEVDQIDRSGRTGWSVLVQGRAAATDLTGAPPRPSLAGLEPWADGERGLLVRVEVASISGRRLVDPSLPEPRGSVDTVGHSIRR